MQQPSSITSRSWKKALADGTYTSLIMVYGIMADKDFDSIMPLFPENATWIFTTPDTRRAEPATEILARYSAFCEKTGRSASRLYVNDSVRDAVAMAENRFGLRWKSARLYRRLNIRGFRSGQVL